MQTRLWLRLSAKMLGPQRQPQQSEKISRGDALQSRPGCFHRVEADISLALLYTPARCSPCDGGIPLLRSPSNFCWVLDLWEVGRSILVTAALSQAAAAMLVWTTSIKELALDGSLLINLAARRHREPLGSRKSVGSSSSLLAGHALHTPPLLPPSPSPPVDSR